MKRIAWFVVLKVLECAALFFVGWFYWWLAGRGGEVGTERYITAFMGFPILTAVIIAILILIVAGICWIIRQNIKWSKRLSEWGK